ncbi:MAG: hypothetical protein KJO40_05955 [Deltaproteobacteria bacterium]|nr:hypothetical protein [Deltaproteobacteria bacterium]
MGKWLPRHLHPFARGVYSPRLAMRSPKLFLCSLFLILACGTSQDVEPGGMDGGTEVPDAGPSPVDDVLYLGRFDDSDPDAVRFSWSGSGFAVRFRGTGARATFRGGRSFTVVVDGDAQPDPFQVSDVAGEAYDLASNLPDGEHTIEVYRRTEASNGPTVVVGVEVDGEPLSVPRPTRQLEIVGDSWSTGQGVESSNEVCDSSAQNHFVTWGAIAARAVDAELSTVAWAGKSIVREPMLPLYDRVIGTEDGSTGTIRTADAVFVSLGANDFVAGELPTEFVPAYVSLLEQIRLQHPDALIACIWPQLPDPSETALARSAIDAAIAERAAAGDAQVTGADLELDELVDLACDNYHPGPETHALMADKTIEFLSAELGW